MCMPTIRLIKNEHEQKNKICASVDCAGMYNLLLCLLFVRRTAIVCVSAVGVSHSPFDTDSLTRLTKMKSEHIQYM